MRDEGNTAIVRRFIQSVLIGRDSAILDAFVSPEFIVHGPGPYECGRRGFHHLLQTSDQVAEKSRKPRGIIDAICEEGDRVMAWFHTETAIPVDRYLSPQMLEFTRDSAEATGIRVRAAVPATLAVLVRLNGGRIEEL